MTTSANQCGAGIKPAPQTRHGQEQTAISVSITKDLLARIDARAAALGLTRSRYLAVVAQQDIEKGGPLVIAAGGTSEPKPPPELTPAALDFLKFAIPVLTQYQDSNRQCPPPQAPPQIAGTELWPFFLKQRDQILEDKWNTSKAVDHDIGMERAIREWLQRNYLVWAPEELEDEDTEESDGTNTAGTAPTTNPA